MPESVFPAEGGCDCRAIRYRMESAPIVVHCCHCRWCQRESGAAFALNAMIESDRVSNLGAAPELVPTPSESGRGQQVARCPHCRVAVWSHYSGSGPFTKFIRVGTLDQPDLLPPDVHIFTASKQPWVVLPAGMPAFDVFYEREKIWRAESLERRAALPPLRSLAGIAAALTLPRCTPCSDTKARVRRPSNARSKSPASPTGWSAPPRGKAAATSRSWPASIR